MIGAVRDIVIIGDAQRIERILMGRGDATAADRIVHDKIGKRTVALGKFDAVIGDRDRIRRGADGEQGERCSRSGKGLDHDPVLPGIIWVDGLECHKLQLQGHLLYLLIKTNGCCNFCVVIGSPVRAADSRMQLAGPQTCTHNYYDTVNLLF
jgi:hypothetical protein